MKIDEIDRKILAELQRDASLPLETLGDRVGLSRNACWRRVKALEASAVIAARVAILDADAIDLPFGIFMELEPRQQSADWSARLHTFADATPEILGVWRVSGHASYLMRAQVADMSAYDTLHQRLVDELDLSGIRTSFVMERLKDTTALPV